VVARGRQPIVRACGQCHLPNGLGHPESAGLAGLPAAYIAGQMTDYKKGVRKGSAGPGIMAAIAGAATDEEINAAAAYYSTVKQTPWVKVVEAPTVPKSYVGAGNMRFADEKGGTEAIGSRIIELPQDPAQARLRNSHSGFVAYVPPGSIKKGETLVKTGGATVSAGQIVRGPTTECGICHGADLKGIASIPGIGGRSPIYIVRQLYDMQHGVRGGQQVELMKAVVVDLSVDDMVAIAAYVASRTP